MALWTCGPIVAERTLYVTRLHDTPYISYNMCMHMHMQMYMCMCMYALQQDTVHTVLNTQFNRDEGPPVLGTSLLPDRPTEGVPDRFSAQRVTVVTWRRAEVKLVPCAQLFEAGSYPPIVLRPPSALSPP